MRKWLIRNLVQALLALIAFFARRPALTPFTTLLTRALAAFTVQARGIGRADSVAELGPLWQRAFPSPRQVPLTGGDARTVFAEIRTPCPLRGSGDVHACHRMMEFDREVLRRAGGQFVVLESQARPGRTHCRVAMRLRGESLQDLRPAHAPR